MKPINSILILLILNGVLTNLTAQSSEFYGITYNGGEYNCGTIFKTDQKGNNLQVVYQIPSINMGSLPVGKLCESIDGKLYGMTNGGGLKDLGTLFEWDPVTKTFAKKLDFNGIGNGSSPYGSLVSTDNGKLLGMTGYGGEYDKGILFEWDPLSDTYTKILDFNGYEKGSSPGGSLIKAKNGKFYGLTARGGEFNCGIIFEWDRAEEKFTKKYDFKGGAFGESPYGSLIQANNELLYGITWNGGAYGDGVIFEWDPATNVYTKRFDFHGNEYGREPAGSLFQSMNGTIYGMTSSGGVYDMGVFFEWDPVTNIYSKKIDFNGSEKGRYPYGSFLQPDSGKLYGLTTFGGKFDQGVLFEWDLVNQTYVKKLDFNGNETGAWPNFLMQTENGKIFVTTIAGGVNEEGTIIECEPLTDTYIKRMTFIDNQADNGKNPCGTLVQADNGKLYGLTNQGGVINDSTRGAYSNGVLFEFDPVNRSYIKKFDFDWTEYGGKPMGSLIKADNGKLYGMTPEGGIYYDSYSGYISHGVLFEWDPVIDSFSVMYKFNKIDGSYPQGSLNTGNGKLYGMTSEGGIYNNGVIFEFDYTNNTYSKRFDFNLIEDGGDPRGTLIEANNRMLYGVTFSGGKFGAGVLFSWDPNNNTYTKLLDFNENDGENPGGSLVQSENGKIYGLTPRGGVFDSGILFEWDPVNSLLVKKLDFNSSTTGGSPYGSLIHGSKDKLYGFTWNEVENVLGILFEWDTGTDSFTIKYDFREKKDEESNNNMNQLQKAIGKLIMMPDQSDDLNKEILDSYNIGTPQLKSTEQPTIKGIYFGSALTEVKYNTYSTFIIESCDRFASPSSKYIWTASGKYLDTIPNYRGGDSIITVNLTVKNSSRYNLFSVECDHYISPSGKVWSESGEYSDTLINCYGCDSILTVNLTINVVNRSVDQYQSILTANASGALYQWIDCNYGNAPVEGETHQTFTAKTDGNYAVIVSQNGCIDTSECFSVIMNGLLINTFKHDITLYPNPTDGSFTIDLGVIYPNAEITITALNGRIIRKDYIINSRFKDLLISESPGQYMVAIAAENKRAVFKLVKK